MGERFVAWDRSQVYGLARPDVVEGGRLQADLPLTLVDLNNPSQTRGGSTPFEILGPGDVAGLIPGAITARVPAPGSWDAIETKAAHVEFAAPDLPWRYTPRTATAAEGLRPWLVLVIGQPGTEVLVRPDSRVELTGTVLKYHPLDSSKLWAHVHDLGGRAVARILSPRDMVEDTAYIAALVPAFQVVGDEPNAALADSWDDNTTSVVLPCYEHWSFRTGPKGDFADLAVQLKPIAAESIEGFAVAKVRYEPLDAGAQQVQPPINLDVNAALTRVPSNNQTLADGEPIDPAVASEVAGLVASARTYQGRWVLTLPRYDEPWPSSSTTGWREELRSDPRRRGVAGLGAWAGIAWQQRIADAAAAQAGALAIAAQRIRHLTLGLAATRRLWSRRVPPATEPRARLATLAPALARLPTGQGSVLEAIGGRTSRLVAALFSSAAQRVLRPGPARTALARPGASRFTEVLAAANRCPEPDERDELAERLARPREPLAFRALIEDARARAGDEREHLDALLEHLPGWVLEGLGVPPAGLVAALDPGDGRPPDLRALREAVDRVPREPDRSADEGFHRGLHEVFGPRERSEWERPCRPVDLDELGRRVADAIDPTVARPLVVERVLGTIAGLAEPKLAPPDFSPELDIPMWKFLDERARDWLLPGVADLPAHAVVALQSNPVFVDAFLAGVNHQTLGELRWRNVPVATGWTPLRRFWQRIALPADPKDTAGGTPDTDIRPIGAWTDGSALGALSHQVDPANATQLVVVFKTELFRRFPATVVYLTPATLDANGNPTWATTPDVDDPAATRVQATMTGSVGPEVVFFGFPVPPAAGRTHWVVLEEPPPGYRFYTKEPSDACERADLAKRRALAADGAAFAEATYALPVRVFLGKLLPP